MILKLWCKGTNKRECYNGINAEPLTVVSRDLKLIKDSHPKYVISMDRLYLTELLSLQGVWDKTWET